MPLTFSDKEEVPGSSPGSPTSSKRAPLRAFVDECIAGMGFHAARMEALWKPLQQTPSPGCRFVGDPVSAATAVEHVNPMAILPHRVCFPSYRRLIGGTATGPARSQLRRVAWADLTRRHPNRPDENEAALGMPVASGPFDHCRAGAATGRKIVRIDMSASEVTDSAGEGGAGSTLLTTSPPPAWCRRDSNAPSSGHVAAGTDPRPARSARNATSDDAWGTTLVDVLASMNHDCKNMDDGPDRLRNCSKLLFGNADRVEVAAAIARSEPGALFSRALATELQWPDNRVQLQLKQFAAAGLFVALPPVGGERRVYYERIASSYWRAAAELEKEWGAGRQTASNRS